MKVLYTVSQERILEEAVNGINELIEFRSRKGHRCDAVFKTWCSWATSLLDINQREELGYRCSKKCPFKHSRLEEYKENSSILYRLVKE